MTHEDVLLLVDAINGLTAIVGWGLCGFSVSVTILYCFARPQKRKD